MDIERIIREIKSGNLVIAPTDTVYGILADAYNLDAVKKVFRCKRRTNKALVVLMSDVEMLEKHVEPLMTLEREIVDRYFPGKLTVLFRKNRKIPDEVTCGSEFVGIRIPDNTMYCSIIREIGHPLIATSANMSGQHVIVNSRQIPVELLENISYVEDGGALDGEPSSIIQVVGDKIKVYRNGEVVKLMQKEMKEKFLGDN